MQKKKLSSTIISTHIFTLLFVCEIHLTEKESAWWDLVWVFFENINIQSLDM